MRKKNWFWTSRVCSQIQIKCSKSCSRQKEKGSISRKCHLSADWEQAAVCPPFWRLTLTQLTQTLQPSQLILKWWWPVEFHLWQLQMRIRCQGDYQRCLFDILRPYQLMWISFLVYSINNKIFIWICTKLYTLIDTHLLRVEWIFASGFIYFAEKLKIWTGQSVYE